MTRKLICWAAWVDQTSGKVRDRESNSDEVEEEHEGPRRYYAADEELADELHSGQAEREPLEQVQRVQQNVLIISKIRTRPNFKKSQPGSPR